MPSIPSPNQSRNDDPGYVGNLIVTDTHILDVRTGTYTRGDVLCRDGRIEAAGDHVDPAPGTPALDGHGMFLTPGLIDAHVHVTAVSADLGSNDASSPFLLAAQTATVMRAMLARGFTTVRDAGGADWGLAKAQADGLLPGPRLHFCGHALSQTGGHADFRGPGEDNDPLCGHGVGRIVDGVDAVRTAVRDELRKGAHHIKVMASGGVASPTDRIDSTQFSPDELRTAVEEAAGANRYVAAHAYTARAIDRALEAGVRSIEHGNLLEDSSLKLFLSTGSYLVPTLVTYWALKREGREHGQTAASAAKTDLVLDAGLQALERAHQAGVTIAFGTDLLGGMHRHQNEEFRLRAQAQPLLSVLQSATVVAAELLGENGHIGELIPQARADLLLWRTNPLSDASVLSEPDNHLHLVVQNGIPVATGAGTIDS